MQEGFGQVSTEMRPKRSMQGQIVEVEGGRIIRALGRKDRHSKVCTAKGPKDRRVRLSANTAIRFYDVQDRLGYDRPSKAIDWLMNEAKAAIEALNGDLDNELPPAISNPSTIAVTQYYHQSDQTTPELDEFYNTNDQPHCGYQSPENRNQNQQQNVTELIQTNSLVGFFNSYTEGLNSRNRNQAQDLCLALQSYQDDPMILLQDTTTTMTTTTTTLFSANSTPLDFEGTAEMVQFQRMVTSNSNPISSKEKESEAAQGSLFEIDSSLPRHLEPNILDQNHSLFSHREPLQSSFSPSIQASLPPPNTSFGIGFANDGFLGFSFSATGGETAIFCNFSFALSRLISKSTSISFLHMTWSSKTCI